MDRIERQVDIDATAERVWGLVSRPGWFINDGRVVDHRIEEVEEGVHLVHDPTHGVFRVRTEKLDPPHHAVFSWVGRVDDDQSTQVEIRIRERPGGVTLTVVESGFEGLGLAEAEPRRHVAGQVEGWEIELAAARGLLDPLTVERTVHVEASPERLWEVLTTPEHFAAWYAFDGADFEPRAGAPMELRWAEHGTFRGGVVEVDAPRRFAYRIAMEPGTDPGADDSTLVTFEVRASGTGSLLTVTQVGFDALAARFGDAADNAAVELEGWNGGLTTLTEHLSATRGR
ncbi:SRPBCC domain-containing protein [Nocardiopsis sp. SBT366]|uniref:SRPBCC domain-containing protein n=1 Tax=Nocardiopsis sp. SBT366 TaxID=1580529 RepID=UPI00066A6225|nr:SRPBCC domain-containing protein [Nocardiopsis sp. SBT366]